LDSPIHRRRRWRRDTRGTTIVEYAIVLFVLLVIGAIALRVLGMTMEKKVGEANKHLSGQASQTSGENNAPASTATGAAAAAAAAEKAKGGGQNINNDPTAQGGGNVEKPEEVPQGGAPFIVRFALIALGVIGAAAAFFAISKGKPAG
jgi:hypothetical protein